MDNNDLQNIINETIQGYLSHNNINNNNNNNNYNENLINILNYLIRSNNTLMNHYHSTINNYNTNIRQFAQIVNNLILNINTQSSQHNTNTNRQTTQTPSRANRSFRNNRNNQQYRFPDVRQPRRPTTTTTPFFSDLFTHNPRFDNIFTNINIPQAFQDVVISPSEEQINNATEVLEYDDSTNLINTQCPITLGEFQAGDQIRRIIYCGHSFQNEAILNWFQTNVQCPICRYDIRDYNVTTPVNTVNSDISNNTQPTSPISNVINNSIESLLRNAFTNMDTSYNSVDTSNNIVDTSNNRQFTRILTSDINLENNTPLLRLNIPFQYEEFYDSSGNFLGNNTQHFS